LVPLVVSGIIGWSNKRGGVEFYHSWDDGRWGKRIGRYAAGEPEHGGWGRLLADEIEAALGHAEGRPITVLVGERGGSSKALTAPAAEAARAAIAAEERGKVYREISAEKDLIFEDLFAILRALGLGDHARPISAHDVVQREILPAIAALTQPEKED
jgi:hypothetical protein